MPMLPPARSEYVCLAIRDQLYCHNLSRCMSPEFHILIRKLAADLNMLLHYKYTHFWAQLTGDDKQSQSLRKCLASCLLVLPRRRYEHFVSTSACIDGRLPHNVDNSTYKLFSTVMRSVLFVYHRIVHESQPEEQALMYYYWILDIPKILNLISIYGESNGKIIREMVQTLFVKMPQYEDDVIDFIAILEQDVMEALHLDLAFEFTNKIISGGSNFSNPRLSFTRNLIKSFFRIYDIFCTLCDFLQYFPIRHIRQLLASPTLLLDLLDCYFKYLHNTRVKWQLAQDFTLTFRNTMQAIRQKIITFFIHCFDALTTTLTHRLQQEVWNSCVKVYYQVCLQFVSRHKNNQAQNWQSLVNILIAETPHRCFFASGAVLAHVLTPQQMGVIEQCVEYERRYKEEKSKSSFDKEQKLAMKLSQIKSYKQFLEFQAFNQYSLGQADNEQPSLSPSVQQDSILCLIFSQLQARHSKPPGSRPKKPKQPAHTYPDFPSVEYNDEPVEEAGEAGDWVPAGVWDEEEGDVVGEDDVFVNVYGHLWRGGEGSAQQQGRNGKNNKKNYIAREQLSVAFKTTKHNTSNKGNTGNVGQNIFKKRPAAPVYEDLSIAFRSARGEGLPVRGVEEEDDGASVMDVLEALGGWGDVSDLEGVVRGEIGWTGSGQAKDRYSEDRKQKVQKRNRNKQPYAESSQSSNHNKKAKPQPQPTYTAGKKQTPATKSNIGGSNNRNKFAILIGDSDEDDGDCEEADLSVLDMDSKSHSNGNRSEGSSQR